MAESLIKIEQNGGCEPAQWTTHQSLTMANPGNPLNDDSFETARRAESYILRQIGVAIERLPRNSKRAILKKKLKKVQRHHRSVKKTVALVGMSGHGKSSVLGETVNRRGISKTSGIGRAVTYNIQEFQQRPADASYAYAIVCTFMKLNQRKELMESLLHDSRRIDLEEISPNDREFKTMNENAKAAVSVLKSALCGVSGFDLQLIKYGTSGITREAAIELLHHWVEQMPLPLGASEDGKFTQEFDDTESLQKAVHSFQQSGMWCFVKAMKIMFDSDVLKDGLVIADLPGTFDANYLRAGAADKYLPRAQEIWVVARIDRVVDSPVLEHLADRYFRENQGVGELHRPVVNIICTFAGELPDDIDWVGDLLVNPETLEEAEQQYEDAEESGSAQEIKLADYRLRKLKMEARNASVTAELKSAWSGTFGSKELKVFCVDNKLHRSPSQMEKELSGILELRNHASNIMAQTLYKNALESICLRTPALISSYQTYIDILKNPPVDLDKELEIGLQEIQQAEVFWATWQKAVSGACGEITKMIRIKGSVIVGSAQECLRQWKSLPWSTLGAFFRRDGIYKLPGSSAPVSWCGQLLECILRVIRPLWKKLDKLVNSAWQNLISNIIGRFDTHEEKYQDGIGLDTVIRLLRSRKNSLKSMLEAEQVEFKQNILDIKRKAVTSDTNSFIFSFMEAVFREGAADCGKGIKARNVARLAAAVENGAFLTAYATKVDKACGSLINSTKQKFKDVLNEVASEIKADLEPVIAAQAADDFYEKHPFIHAELDAYMWDITLKEAEMNSNAEKAKVLAERLWGADAHTDADTNSAAAPGTE